MHDLLSVWEVRQASMDLPASYLYYNSYQRILYQYDGERWTGRMRYITFHKHHRRPKGESDEWVTDEPFHDGDVGLLVWKRQMPKISQLEALTRHE